MSIQRGIVVKTTKPTSNDDSSKGFYVGFRWFYNPMGQELVCKDASVGAAKWESSGSLNKLFEGIDTVGGLTVTTTAQPIPLDLEVIKDEDFYTHDTVTNNSEVTFVYDGWYKISALTTVACVSAAGGQRGNPQMHLEIDTGGGFIEQPDQTGGYIRENATETLSTSLSGTGVFFFNAGDKMRITIMDSVPSPPDEETVAYSSRLVIEYMDRLV